MKSYLHFFKSWSIVHVYVDISEAGEGVLWSIEEVLVWHAIEDISEAEEGVISSLKVLIIEKSNLEFTSSIDNL